MIQLDVDQLHFKDAGWSNIVVLSYMERTNHYCFYLVSNFLGWLENILLSTLYTVSVRFHLSQPQQDEPFVVLKRQEDGSITHEGYCIDLLRELSKRLHFSYHIETSPDGLYGAKLENGSWYGMIGELLNNVWNITVFNRPISIN